MEQNKSLRPNGFTDYIGQNKVKDQVLTAIKSAILRDTMPEHILLYGPQGLGKTTMAHIIANAMQTDLIEVSGPLIEKAGDIISVLAGKVSEGNVVFIDEIHRMDKKAEEVLYSAMEDQYINIFVGKMEQQRAIRVDLPKFTLVGATTRAGMLSAPLRDRFGLSCKMEFYSKDELAMIILAAAKKMHLCLEQKDALEIANNSRGTPRIAIALTKRVRDYAVVNTDGIVTTDTIHAALLLAGVKKDGLHDTDVCLLNELASSSRPIGLATLSRILGEDQGTIEDVYEPYLLQKRYIEKTPRGRIITELGKRVLEDKV